MRCRITSYGIDSASVFGPLLHKTRSFMGGVWGWKNEVGERVFGGVRTEHAGVNSELKTFVFKNAAAAPEHGPYNAGRPPKAGERAVPPRNSLSLLSLTLHRGRFSVQIRHGRSHFKF